MTSIATLGSHCSLQVLKGAKDEGLKTILVCERKREKIISKISIYWWTNYGRFLQGSSWSKMPISSRTKW